MILKLSYKHSSLEEALNVIKEAQAKAKSSRNCTGIKLFVTDPKIKKEAQTVIGRTMALRRSKMISAQSELTLLLKKRTSKKKLEEAQAEVTKWSQRVNEWTYVAIYVMKSTPTTEEDLLADD